MSHSQKARLQILDEPFAWERGQLGTYSPVDFTYHQIYKFAQVAVPIPDADGLLVNAPNSKLEEGMTVRSVEVNRTHTIPFHCHLLFN